MSKKNCSLSFRRIVVFYAKILVYFRVPSAEDFCQDRRVGAVRESCCWGFEQVGAFRTSGDEQVYPLRAGHK